MARPVRVKGGLGAKVLFYIFTHYFLFIEKQ